ncbi:MAG TPA: DMT family transporter [Ktedonobacteraceae bacterium]
MTINETTVVEATFSTRSPQTPGERQRKLRANALLIVVTMIWGSSFLIVQHTLTLVGPFTFLAMRFGFAVLVLAFLFRKRLIYITHAEILTGSIIGLFLFASYAFQTVSLQYTTSSQAGFISGMYVPLVAILAIPLLKQKPTLGGILGILLSMSGLILLSIKNGFQITIGPGEILALACAFASALHVISISKFAPKADAINLTIVQIALTAVLSLIAMPIAKEPFSIPPFAVWGSALFLGVVATAFCLAVMNWVQQFVSSTEAAMFYALELVWVSALGHFAGDNLSLLGWIGCGCMLSSMVVGEMRLSRIMDSTLLRYLASMSYRLMMQFVIDSVNYNKYLPCKQMKKPLSHFFICLHGSFIRSLPLSKVERYAHSYSDLRPERKRPYRKCK